MTLDQEIMLKELTFLARDVAAMILATGGPRGKGYRVFLDSLDHAMADSIRDQAESIRKQKKSEDDPPF